MLDLLMSPIFWIGVALVIVAFIVLSALISNKRNKEVEELGTYFPEEEIVDSSRISVEKVRRSTLARQQRKQASQHLPRRKPREDVLELEKQEFVVIEKEDNPSKRREDESIQEEENVNLPAVQEDAPKGRQFNRRQFKSSVLQSRSAETTEESTNTSRRRSPLPTNNNPTTSTRPPVRRPVGNKTAYPSLRKDANETTTSKESPAPRFPNRRSKRMF
jgi:hypothetical protein